MSNPVGALPNGLPRRQGAVHRRRPWGDILRDLLVTQELALAVGLTAAVSIAITADFVHAATFRPGAYALAVAFGALILVRRRAPRTILAVTVFGIFAYYVIGFPPIGMALPATGALYSAAETDHTRTAVVGGAVFVAVSAYFRIQEEALSTTYLFSYDVLTNLALAAAAITLGVNVRNRRALHDHQRKLQELTAGEVRRVAEQRMQAERLQIARDLHDAIGHSISVIALHSNVAREAVGHDDASASRAITQVQVTASATLRNLRRTVRLLRSPVKEPSQTVPTGVAGLEHLARTARNVGIDVSLAIEIDPDTVPTAIDATVFRIVQEAVTNMIRHSGARHGNITVRSVGDSVRIEVTDDGRGPGGERRLSFSDVVVAPRGQGLLGMRERADLLGGTVDAGPQPRGGFAVRAELPVGLDP